jgi:hypothetical protein
MGMLRAPRAPCYRRPRLRVKAPGDGAKPVDSTPDAPAAGATGGVAGSQGANDVAPTGAVGGADATAPADVVGDVARRLRSGDLNPREAVELLIDDAVRRQVGKATADRESLASELKDLLRRYTETDPYLASKVRRLGNQK